MSLLAELLILEAKKKEEKVDGTYVGAKFDEETVKNLSKMMNDIKIPNPLDEKDFHTTIIFSRTKFPENFEALGDMKKPWIGTPKEFDIFTGRNGQNCLVMKYECAEQVKRHKKLMKENNATYDWPEYKVHLTLSYDCGDFDPKKFDPKDYINQIVINNEYTTPLELDWLANKDKDDSKDD